MLGLHLNPNKRRLTLAESIHVHTNEQTTDGFRGPSCLSSSDETTDLTARERQGEDWNARSVSLPDMQAEF